MTTKHEEPAASPHALLIGTKTGICDICKETKKILLLRYGFTLCEDCLNICTGILEQLSSQPFQQQSKDNTVACRKPKVSKLNASNGRKNKPKTNMEIHGA